MKSIYGIDRVPCDSQLRDILDLVDPAHLRAAFTRVFSLLQRGKALEQMRFLGQYYLISCDGTGFYYSLKVGNEGCLRKKHGDKQEKGVKVLPTI